MKTILKAQYLQDADVYIMDLPHGSYCIDGQMHEAAYGQKQTQLNSVDDIRRVTVSRVLVRYESADGSAMSVDDYRAQREVLEKALEFDDDGYIISNDLDAEYAYKKFKQNWTAIYRDVVEKSDPLPVQVTHSGVLDTGNPHVTSLFSVGAGDVGVYQYTPNSVAYSLLADVMDELGMKQNPSDSYQATLNNKTWGHERGDCQHITGFGKFLSYMKRYSSNRPIRGSLEKCLSDIESMKKRIETETRALYAIHYPENNLSLDVKALLNTVDSLGSRIAKIDSKKNTYSDYVVAVKSVRELREMLISQINESAS